MGLERDTYLDADDMTVSVTQSLLDVQAPSHDDADEYEDGCAVLREAVQVTSHGRVVSSAVQELPVSIHGESTRARAAAAALTAHVDAEDEVEEKDDKRGAVRATATQMVWFPFTTCRLIYNIGCLRHSMDRKDE